MGMEEALVARLKASAFLNMVAEQNIAFFERPRAGALAAITLTNVTPGVAWTNDGPDTLVIPRIQFDAWGSTKTEVAAVARGIRSEMERLDRVIAGGWEFFPPGLLEMERQSIEPLDGTTGVFRWMQDFTFSGAPV